MPHPLLVLTPPTPGDTSDHGIFILVDHSWSHDETDVWLANGPVTPNRATVLHSWVWVYFHFSCRLCDLCTTLGHLSSFTIFSASSFPFDLVSAPNMESGRYNFEKSFVGRTLVSPQWLPGCDSVFWYRREMDSGKFQFIMANCEKGFRAPAFEHTRLAEELGAQTKEHIDPFDLPFWWINLDTNAAWVRFQHKGRDLAVHAGQRIRRVAGPFR